jgi:hypothetical protein
VARAWARGAAAALRIVVLAEKLVGTATRATVPTNFSAGRRRRGGGRAGVGSRYALAMHGMLSAGILIAFFAAVAVAAGFVALRLYRGGTHE